MSAPRTVIDGAQYYGSYVIAVASDDFIFDDITIDRPTEDATDMDEVGRPARARYTAGRVTGTATVQIPASGVRPTFGQTFSEEFDPEYGTETFVIKEAPFNASSAPTEIRKVSVTFAKVYDTITTVA